MTSPRSSKRILSQGIAALLVAVPLAASSAFGQAIVVNGTTTYTQNFNTLGTATAAWTDNNTAIGLGGWYAGQNANNTADGNSTVSDGSNGALLGLLNLGTVSVAERAIGSKTTGDANSNIGYGVLFQNTSGGDVTIGNISYAGELWRSNSSTAPLTAERWDVFMKVSDTLFTDVEPGLNANTAALGSFTALDALDWISGTPAANTTLDGNLAANREVKTFNAGVTLAAGDFFMLRWIDSNLAGTDGHQGIDDFSITFTAPPAPIVRTFNRSHTVGGAPNGILAVSANQYWLNGATPIGFGAGDTAVFSQDGDANITVPSDIATAGVTVSNAAGTYTIGGAGKMSGIFIKSNFGTAVLTSANAFTVATLSGGGTSKLVTQNVSALGTGGLRVTSGGGTLQTDVDLTLGAGISGSGALIKTGPGILTIAGTGSGSGGITVNQGTLRTNSDAAVGGNAQTVTLNGTTIQFTNTAAVTYSDATKLRTLAIGTGGGTISVTDTSQANGVAISRANGLTGSTAITKTGAGVLRVTAAQATLSSNWTINAGALEASSAANALGAGSVTVNAGGILVVQSPANVTPPTVQTTFTINNSVTLNGGSLGTRSGDFAVFGGPVNVATTSGVSLRSNSTPATAQSLTISGVLSGSADLNITGTAAFAAATLTLTNPLNTFSGNFNVGTGQTLRSLPATTGSTLSTADIILSDSTLQLRDNGSGNNGVLNYGNNLFVESGLGTLNVDRVSGGNSGNVFALGSLTLGPQVFTVTGANSYGVRIGAVHLTGSPTMAVQVTTTIAGVIDGPYDLFKTGAGTLVLDAINSFLGPTAADAGTLIVNGSLSASNDVAMTGTSTLGGTGAIAGALTLIDTSTLAPGVSGAGTLSSGTLTIDTDAKMTIEIGGKTTGAYDRIIVTGAINLTDPVLTGSMINGFLPQVNDLFFILLNDDTDPIDGTFTGLGQGATMTFTGGQQYLISYTGDSGSNSFTGGNDLVLKAIPEPGTYVSLLGGLASLIGLQRFRRRS
jgi:autotransporter-associated beta strand protein